MNTILYKSTHLGEVIDADEKMGIVKGYGSIFGNVDSDGDIINKGAYKKTIQENGSRVKYLYQHDMDKPIGKMVHLEEDEKGLVFEAQVPKTRLGMDVIELMKAGVITENSVGILPIVKEDKGQYRELREVKLFEISAVTMAANDEAKILDVKGNKNINNVYQKYDNLCKLIRKGDISDEMGYAIESEIYKLKSLFINATQPTVVTEPVQKKEQLDVYKYLLNNLK